MDRRGEHHDTLFRPPLSELRVSPVNIFSYLAPKQTIVMTYVYLTSLVFVQELKNGEGGERIVENGCQSLIDMFCYLFLSVVPVCCYLIFITIKPCEINWC
jgi:hypothetical protein